MSFLVNETKLLINFVNNESKTIANCMENSWYVNQRGICRWNKCFPLSFSTLEFRYPIW